MTNSSKENPTNPNETTPEKPQSVETGQLQELSKEQLITLVLELQKKVQGLSEQTVQAAETRIASAINSLGGSPEDIKVGEVALSGVNKEIKSLGHNAGAEMSTILAESPQTVETPPAREELSATESKKTSQVEQPKITNPEDLPEVKLRLKIINEDFDRMSRDTNPDSWDIQYIDNRLIPMLTTIRKEVEAADIEPGRANQFLEDLSRKVKNLRDGLIKKMTPYIKTTSKVTTKEAPLEAPKRTPEHNPEVQIPPQVARMVEMVNQLLNNPGEPWKKKTEFARMIKEQGLPFTWLIGDSAHTNEHLTNFEYDFKDDLGEQPLGQYLAYRDVSNGNAFVVPLNVENTAINYLARLANTTGKEWKHDAKFQKIKRPIILKLQQNMGGKSRYTMIQRGELELA